MAFTLSCAELSLPWDCEESVALGKGKGRWETVVLEWKIVGANGGEVPESSRSSVARAGLVVLRVQEGVFSTWCDTGYEADVSWLLLAAWCPAAQGLLCFEMVPIRSVTYTTQFGLDLHES